MRRALLARPPRALGLGIAPRSEKRGNALEILDWEKEDDHPTTHQHACRGKLDWWAMHNFICLVQGDRSAAVIAR